MSEDNQPPVHPRPLLDAGREVWWMNEIDRSNVPPVNGSMTDARRELQRRRHAPGGNTRGSPADAPAPRAEPLFIPARTSKPPSTPVWQCKPGTSIAHPVTRGGLPRRDVFAKPSDTRLPFGGAPRCVVPIECSRHGGSFLVTFRQNRLSKVWFFERVTPAGSSGNGEPGDKQTYSLAELPFDKVRCPHCRMGIPIHCGQCEKLYCRGGVDESSQRFRCRCGLEATLGGGLETIDGFQHQAPQRGALSGPDQARLPGPPALLLTDRRGRS